MPRHDPTAEMAMARLRREEQQLLLPRRGYKKTAMAPRLSAAALEEAKRLIEAINKL